MSQLLTDDQQKIFYVLRVNGQDISQKYENQMLAEVEKRKLPPETQPLAEVVPVTANGQQLLFG